MTDHDIDRLLRDASPLSDARAAALDLRAAEEELVEGILARSGEALPDGGPTLAEAAPPERRNPRGVTLLAAAAALLLVVLAVRSWSTPDRSEDREPDVATDQPTPTDDGGLPRLLADDVPAPFELVDADTLYGQATVGAALVVVPEDAVVHEVLYAGPAAEEWIQVRIAEGDVGDPAGGYESATIRGHEGAVSSVPAPSGPPRTRFVARWEEAPGVTVTVTAESGALATDDVLAFAESLRAVGDDEWAAADHVDVPLGPAEVQALVPDDARAELTVPADGVVAYLAGDGRTCAVMADEQGTRGSQCLGEPGPGPLLVRDRNGWPLVLVGTLPEGATQVEATRDGVDIRSRRSGRAVDEGRPPSVQVADPPAGGGPRLYAVAVDIVPDMLFFLDAGRDAVGTTELDIVPGG